MFERYTEKSRRVIFFARYEASQYGSPLIETEHMLLGLLRENTMLVSRFLNAEALKSIRGQVDDRTTVREKTPTSVDLPLSPECKRVLAFGAEESERQGHKHIGVLHLLAGLLQEEKSYGARLLHERGLRIDAVREELGREPTEATGAPLTITHTPQVFYLPVDTHAELARLAHASGVEIQSLLLSVLKNALSAPASAKSLAASDGVPKENYQRLRRQIEAEGWSCLDAAQLEEEQARRKGSGRS